jgi:hypothetical protein
MKKLILITSLFLISLFSQAQQAQAFVDSLNAEYIISGVISPESNTSFERFVSVNHAYWDIQNKGFKIKFMIYVLNPQRKIIRSFTNDYSTIVSNINNVNSVGGDVPKDTPESIGEYDFLYLAIENNQINIIDLIRSQITKLDSEGKFN